MNENTKKHISTGYAIVLIVLAAIFTIFSVMPAVKIDSDEISYPEIYEAGRFTSHAKDISEVEIGFGTVIKGLLNFKDVKAVFSIQSLENQINKRAEKLLEAEADLAEYVLDNAWDMAALEEGEFLNSTHKSLHNKVEDAKAELADSKIKLEDARKELGEEGEKALIERMEEDAEFVGVINAVYSFLGYVQNDFEEAVETFKDDAPTTDDGDFGVVKGIMDMLLVIISIIVLGLLIIFSVVYPIIIIIFFIVKLVQFLTNLDKLDDADATDARMDKFPFAGYASKILILYALFALVSGSGVSIGAGVIGAVVIWILSNVIRAVKKALYEDENRVLVIVKQAITVVSIIALALVLLNFTSIDLIGNLSNSIDTLGETYYDVQVDALAKQGLSADTVMSKAASNVVGKLLGSFALVMGVSLIGFAFIASSLVKSIERVGNKAKANKARPIIAILVLIVAIIPTTLGVKTIDDREKAFEEGKFKICYTAHEEKGSPEYIGYELLKKTQEYGVEYVEELEKEVEKASGEELEELKEELEYSKSQLADIEDEIKDTEKQKSRCTAVIIFAVLFVIAEFAYKFADKFVPAPKKKEEGEATEAVAEEAVAEEAVAEEAVAEEAVVEEAVAEEAVAEEAVVEEAVAEEVVAEEAVAEEAVVEEAVAEETAEKEKAE